MTLAEFLLARFSDDEAAAVACPPTPWRVATLDDEAAAHDEDTWAGETVAAADGIPVANPYALSGAQTRAVREHIVRHDPARVLAECAAKRRIVERCAAVELPPDAPVVARTAWDAFNVLNRATLRDLAAPYADHPDHRDEWKP